MYNLNLNEFINLSNCKNYVGTSICKPELNDECTIPLYLKQKAQCNILQENNFLLLILNHGTFMVGNKHTWNLQKLNGAHLIQYNYSTTIDNKTYVNHEQKIKNVIHAHQNEQVKVLEILTSDSNYKFINIQEIYKFLVPIKEHSWEFTLYFILMSMVLILIIYSCI